MGIGTLINHRLPAAFVKHIFGSGVGYGTLPAVDERFIIHALRGPLSANALKVSPTLAITDAAVLVRLFSPLRPPSHIRCGFIPHNDSLENFDWSRVCELAGIRFISCQWEVDRVLQAMGACEVLLCEAMHGAIIADTLRIPWIPISLYDDVLTFKWEDWLASLNMHYQPHRIQALYSDNVLPLKNRLKAKTKRLLKQSGIWQNDWTPPPPPATGERELHLAADKLRKLSAQEGNLSDDATISRHLERYQELLHKLSR
ncbi:succinoglycan biosynthesis protein exov [Betaproteobacteria bacterium]|nr:succinoglycan biosynthesis protein exov [Betaproteobacteria bacterium]